MSSAQPKLDRTRGRTLVLAVVTLTWAAAAIHAAVVPEHLREWGPAGAFFIAVAVAQLAWGALVYRRPTRPLLRVGLYGNAALVLLWFGSRTVGLPVGPEAGQAEAFGAHDALATLNELLAGGIAGFLLTGRALSSRITSTSAGSLAAASVLVVLLISPHAHGSSHEHRSSHSDGHHGSHEKSAR